MLLNNNVISSKKITESINTFHNDTGLILKVFEIQITTLMVMNMSI